MNTNKSRITGIAGGVFLGVIWGQVIWRLKGEWSGNPQYGFGWFTPFIAIALGWLRWKSRPATDAAESGVVSSKSIPVLLAMGCVFWALTEALFLTNPDWRVTGWISVIGASIMTLGFWFLLGGLSWLKHFAFPGLFLLTAAPWPGRIELGVTLALTDWITGLTVESLNWIGIPALQVGNLIEMKSTHVGVEEACSGIRSLQVTLMVALALGEFHRMNLGGRLKVLALGLGLTFFSNYCRAFFLAYVAETQGGMAAVDKWHDTAGAGVLLISFVGLGLGAALMAPIRKRSSKKQKSSSLPPIRNLSSSVLAGLLALGPISWGLGHAWVEFRGPEKQKLPDSEASPHWIWEVDVDGVAFEAMEIPEAARELLKYDSALSGFIQQATERWQMYSIKWNPRRSVQHQVLGHQPDVCVTAVGWKFEGDIQQFTAEIEGVKLPFRRYSFTDGRKRLWVFRCEWEERFKEQPESLMTHHSRWIAFWEGRLPQGIRMLEFAIQGVNAETAESELTQLLDQIIKVRSDPS